MRIVPSLLFPCSPAFRAPLGLVLKTLFLVESLLALGKNKFTVAILANKSLICHKNTSLITWRFN